MAGALEDAKVDRPGTDCVAILVGHNAGELMEVGEVVDGPGGEELGQRYGAEGGMSSGAGKVFGLEVEGGEGCETFFAEGSEFVEKLLERFGLRLSHLCEAIKRGEGLGVAVLENESRARNPIVAFGENHVAHDVVGAPRSFSFVVTSPGIRKIAEERVEGCGSAGEKRDGLGQAERGCVCHDSMMLLRSFSILVWIQFCAPSCRFDANDPSVALPISRNWSEC